MKALGLTAALLASVGLTPAAATTLQFTLTGTDFGGAVEFAKFRTGAKPIVANNNFSDGDGFRIKFLSGVFQYGSVIESLQDIQFFSATNGGGFLNLDPADHTGASTFINVAGAQLYTGPESAPTFIIGNYQVSDAYSGAPLSLSIAAVPEPAGWTLLILGFGAVGLSVRRRSKITLYNPENRRSLASS